MWELRGVGVGVGPISGEAKHDCEIVFLNLQ